MSAALDVDNDVARVLLTGVVTENSWMTLAEICVGQLRERQSSVLIVETDFRHATEIAIDPQRVLSLTDSLAGRLISELPGSVIVTERHLPMMRTLAWALAHRGIERHVFSADGAASSWLSERLMFERYRREARERA